MTGTPEPPRFSFRRFVVGPGFFLLVVLFPVLFLGRVISPVDVFTSYDPWNVVCPPTRVQNPLLNDPPTSWLTVMILAKRFPEGFFWNSTLASGIPGWSHLASGLLSPLVFLPALFLPVAWIFTAMIVFRFLAAFGSMYLLLRDDGLDPDGASIGGLLWGGAGAMAVWWLWPHVSVAAFCPLVVLGARLAFRPAPFSRRFLPFTAGTFLVTAGGFPAWTLAAALLALASGLVEALRPESRGRRISGLLGLALAGMIGVAPLLPSLFAFSSFLDATGHLERRRDMALERPVPLAHLRLFFDPWGAGSPTDGSDCGVPGMPGSNNFIENCVEMGRIALPLVLLGAAVPFVLRRRKRTEEGGSPRLPGFWVAVLLVPLLGLYTRSGMELVGRLPGVRNSSLVRIRIVLLFGAAALAAHGASRLLALLRERGLLPRGPQLLVAAIALELALFDTELLPYLRRSEATPRTSASIEKLKEETARNPSRIAATFIALWPNSSEMMGLEDVRSHFWSEADYRRLLEKAEPKGFGAFGGTIIAFDGLRLRAASPALDLLGNRWLAEPPAIRLVEPLSRDDRRESPPDRSLPPLADLAGGARVAQPFASEGTLRRFALWLPRPVAPGELRLRIEEEWSGRTVWSSSEPPGDPDPTGRSWWRTDRLPATFSSSRLRLVLEAAPGARPLVAAAGHPDEPDWENALVDGRPAPAPLSSAFDFGGIVLRPDLGGIDLRVFERLGALPRWWSVREVRGASFDDFLARVDSIDFRRIACVERGNEAEAKRFLAGSGSDRARFTLLDDRPERSEVEVDLDSPSLVATSLKLDSPHRSRLDGSPVSPIRTNGLFRGYLVPAGRHRIELAVGPFARWTRPAYLAPGGAQQR
jgi:hypothetical protein